MTRAALGAVLLMLFGISPAAAQTGLDRGLRLVEAASVVAQAADVYSTGVCIGRNQVAPGICREANPALAGLADNGNALAFVKTGIYVGTHLAIHAYTRSQCGVDDEPGKCRKAKWLALGMYGGQTVLYGYLAHHNLQETSR